MTDPSKRHLETENDPAAAPHLIGYARVSTEDQSPRMQVEALIAAGVDPRDVFEEKGSGAKESRRELKAALNDLQAGDVLVVWKMDRLARSMAHLLRIMEHVQARGAKLRSLTEPSLDPDTPGGLFMIHIFAAFAQLERGLMLERTKAGLAAARAAGRIGGRRETYSHEQIDAAYKARQANPALTYGTLSKPIKDKKGRSITPTRLKARFDQIREQEAANAAEE